MLPQKYRLDKNDIPHIVKRGKKTAKDGYTVRMWYENTLQDPQFAIIVPKKVDNRAAVRNYIKRRISHQIQLNLHENTIPKAKYVIVVHENIFENGKEFSF